MFWLETRLLKPCFHMIVTASDMLWHVPGCIRHGCDDMETVSEERCQHPNHTGKEQGHQKRWVELNFLQPWLYSHSTITMLNLNMIFCCTATSWIKNWSRYSKKACYYILLPLVLSLFLKWLFYIVELVNILSEHKKQHVLYGILYHVPFEHF